MPFFIFIFFTFQEFTLFIEDTRKILFRNTLLFELVCLCVWCWGGGVIGEWDGRRRGIDQ